MEQQFDAIKSVKSIETNYGPQVAREVVQIFIADYPGKLAKLKTAIENGDVDAIRFSAHDIKSGTLSMGIQPMSGVCEVIERDASSLSKERLQEMLHQLEGSYESISRTYGEYLNLH